MFNIFKHPNPLWEKSIHCYILNKVGDLITISDIRNAIKIINNDKNCPDQQIALKMLSELLIFAESIKFKSGKIFWNNVLIGLAGFSKNGMYSTDVENYCECLIRPYLKEHKFINDY